MDNIEKEDECVGKPSVCDAEEIIDSSHSFNCFSQMNHTLDKEEFLHPEIIQSCASKDIALLPERAGRPQ